MRPPSNMASSPPASRLPLLPSSRASARSWARPSPASRTRSSKHLVFQRRWDERHWEERREEAPVMSPEPLAFEVTLAVVSLVSKLMQSRQIEKSTIRSSQSAHVEIQCAAVHTGKHGSGTVYSLSEGALGCRNWCVSSKMTRAQPP